MNPSAHGHGPGDCVPIADLDFIADRAKRFRCSLETAAHYVAMFRRLQALDRVGELPTGMGTALELGMCEAYRRGEPWGADIFRSLYAPEIGDQWRDELLDVVVQASEVNGDPITAVWAHLDYQEA